MEIFKGIVQRITYHNEENGWTVLKVNPIGRPEDVKTVTVHQANVFAGATMEFKGEWTQHNKFGEQFKALEVMEVKPASASALEKYIGSGLIYGVGPKIARRIVKFFGEETLDVFESHIDRLTEVPGISKTKLEQITASWVEHREIRNVMLFLQDHGISTLFAVKIFKTYENKAIEIVRDNPYQLSKDIYGIGFFSADKVALSIGLSKDSPKRIRAAILHVLAASREQGHCYLELPYIKLEVAKLLKENFDVLVEQEIHGMEADFELKTRIHPQKQEKCYYSKTLYFDETKTAELVDKFTKEWVGFNLPKMKDWLTRFNDQQQFPLSEEQYNAIVGIVQHPISILTGGPGCGKTTTTKALVKLLKSQGKNILLAAPTGRAAQRMAEVIGEEAQTIHRLLVWQPGTGQFKRNEEDPLSTDFLIVDECSMLDISLCASLLRAVPLKAQVLFIGDPDQLPSVGAGNVLRDLIESKKVPLYQLLTVFRQAKESLIIKYAHEINKGYVPSVESPIHAPQVWDEGVDCLFIDAEEATKDQARFVKKIRQTMKYVLDDTGAAFIKEGTPDEVEATYKSIAQEDDIYIKNTSADEIAKIKQSGIKPYVFTVPYEFMHADIHTLLNSPTQADALKQVIEDIHPWSTLHFGFTAAETIIRQYTKTVEEKLGQGLEVQILSPMTVGTLGTRSLNQQIQTTLREHQPESSLFELGERKFYVGDRVIQRRNNYDLEVFNGDIGEVKSIDNQKMSLEVAYKNSVATRIVSYKKEDILDLDLGYAITIHKSQGSEFDVVIIPLVMQHFTMLYRNLIYTALTRAKKTAIFIGTRKAFGIAVKNVDNKSRQTLLKEILQEI